MRTPSLSFAILGAVLAVLTAAACAGGSRDDDRTVLTPVNTELLPFVISSDLGVGANRFVLGLLDRDDQPVLGADLHLRFFQIEGQQTTLKFETDADAIRITKTYTHTHDDGTVESHEAGESGVYVANVEFDAAGQWRVQVTGAAGGEELEPVTPLFEVRAESLSPAIGEPAPRSVQPLLSDVSGEISRIDTSEVPIEEMHTMTIADAVTSGKPTVIVFATPAFCLSQICGPAKQIVDDLYAAHQGEANFIHVEPYDIEQARAGKLVPLPLLSDEWGLQSEPWIFIVDADGNIAGKYEGVVSLEELEEALAPLLAGG